MSLPIPAHLLVIDEIPLIATGLREVFRSIHPEVRVEYTANAFTALSARSFEATVWDLIFLDSREENTPGGLLLTAAELKAKFPASRLIIYSSAYDPLIIEKMKQTGIAAYVCKFESVGEILKAWEHVSVGESYISTIFHTLYFEYGRKK